jgi:uncharacterized protein YjbI with pentapeptide repeats
METQFTAQTFDKIDFKQQTFIIAEYEDCSFINCDMSGLKLSGARFIECSFSGCNLSLAKLSQTALQQVKFINCKMLGLRFDECSAFALEVSFDNCMLDHSSFYKLNIKKTKFTATQLHEVDFTQCDISGAVFNNCDLSGATFDKTLLEKADLRTATGYTLDPENNKIRNAMFSLPAVTGLLYKYGIKIEA